MRVSILLAALLAIASPFFASAQLGMTTNCTAAPTCLASPVQVPAAWFNMTFSAPSAAVTAGGANYTWTSSDSGDAACAFKHQGMVGFTAASTQYVDLQAATGPSSYNGQTIPNVWGGLGSGSVAQGTAGWSFEFTLRPGTLVNNNKVFTLGNGGPINTVFAGASGTSILQFGYYDQDTSFIYNNLYNNNVPTLISPTYLQSWYHVVAVFQVISNSTFTAFATNQQHGAEFFYVNGQLINFSATTFNQNNFVVALAQRNFTYLARSQIPAWNDPYFSGAMDTFRIYDRALTQAQVSALYTSEMAGCPISVVANPTVADPAPNIVQPASTGAIPRTFYALNFTTDPRVGGVAAYGWSATAPSDAGNAAQTAIHKGILTFDGYNNATSFVNMSAATGNNSVGVVMPDFGGGSAGWTFEVTVKPGVETTWAKIVDIGSIRPNSGNGCHDIVIGWHATDVGYWHVDVVDANGVEHETVDPFGVVNPGVWYHFVMTITPQHANGMCDYLTYVNGQLYTAVVNVYCPQLVTRANAFLAKSGWADTYFKGELDTFNIYAQQVSDTTVTNMYNVAMLGAQPTVSSTGAPVTARSSSAATSPAAAATSTPAAATSTPAAATSTPAAATSTPAAVTSPAVASPTSVSTGGPVVSRTSALTSAVLSPTTVVSTGPTVIPTPSSSTNAPFAGNSASSPLSVAFAFLAAGAGLAALFVL